MPSHSRETTRHAMALPMPVAATHALSEGRQSIRCRPNPIAQRAHLRQQWGPTAARLPRTPRALAPTAPRAQLRGPTTPTGADNSPLRNARQWRSRSARAGPGTYLRETRQHGRSEKATEGFSKGRFIWHTSRHLAVADPAGAAKGAFVLGGCKTLRVTARRGTRQWCKYGQTSPLAVLVENPLVLCGCIENTLNSRLCGAGGHNCICQRAPAVKYCSLHGRIFESEQFEPA